MEKEEKKFVENLLKVKEIQNGLLTLGTNETANIGKYSYEFVSLPKIRQKLQPYFDKFNWILIQPIVYKDGNQYLVTKIVDCEDGSTVLETEIEIQERAKIENIQKFGGIITYLRRYSITTLLGLTTEKDDDCFITTEEALLEIEKIDNMTKLLKYWKTLGNERLENEPKLKEAFSKKKEEFRKKSEAEKEDILNKAEIDG